MSTSTNGGLAWGPLKHPSGSPSGLGGQPVVQPNGTVIVPFSSASSNAIRAFSSTNGGSSWSASVLVATTSHHTVAGLDDSDVISTSAVPPAALRESVLPSAEIDAAGKVYVAWADCRFWSGCKSNDIVILHDLDLPARRRLRLVDQRRFHVVSAPTQLAGPMNTSWLPNTDQGRMFGDYIATTVLAGGNAVTVIPVAAAPSGSTFAMAMYTPTGGLPITG